MRDTRGDVVDPDEVCAVESNGISTPNVVRVNRCDLDVLDDDVACAADNAQALALDDTGATYSDDGLLGIDCNSQYTGVVVGDRSRWRIGLIVLAPAVLVDGDLFLTSACYN